MWTTWLGSVVDALLVELEQDDKTEGGGVGASGVFNLLAAGVTKAGEGASFRVRPSPVSGWTYRVACWEGKK